MAADMSGRPHPSDTEVGASNEPWTSNQPHPTVKPTAPTMIRFYLRQT